MVIKILDDPTYAQVQVASKLLIEKTSIVIDRTIIDPLILIAAVFLLMLNLDSL